MARDVSLRPNCHLFAGMARRTVTPGSAGLRGAAGVSWEYLSR